MRLILNVLWFVVGGWLQGTLWLVAGCLLAITIVGLPWAGAAFRIAGFAYWPFGKEIVDRADLYGRPDAGTGCMGLALNVIWVVLGRLVAGADPCDVGGGEGGDHHRHPLRAQGPAAGLARACSGGQVGHTRPSLRMTPAA